MTDDADDALRRLDDWLDAAGFVDANDLDAIDANDPLGHTDDPWGDVTIVISPLTSEQRVFLLGTDDLVAADELIIDIPTDPDDIDPFDA